MLPLLFPYTKIYKRPPAQIAAASKWIISIKTVTIRGSKTTACPFELFITRIKYTHNRSNHLFRNNRAKPKIDKIIEMYQVLPNVVPVKTDQNSLKVHLSSDSANCKNPIPIVVMKSAICKSSAFCYNFSLFLPFLFCLRYPRHRGPAGARPRHARSCRALHREPAPGGARPARTRVVLVGVLDHVEASRGASWLSGMRELGGLLLAVYSLSRPS